MRVRATCLFCSPRPNREASNVFSSSGCIGQGQKKEGEEGEAGKKFPSRFPKESSTGGQRLRQKAKTNEWMVGKYEEIPVFRSLQI